MPDLSLFATCPRGVEPLLAAELAALGLAATEERRGGVAARAPLEAAYRACLWSRLASRILLPLRTFPADSPEALYEAALDFDWTDLFASSTTFAVEVAGRSAGITHTHYAGLKVKDAIVDRFRAAGQPRPNVDTERPGLRIHLHLEREQATLSLDLAGDSLHRRGYRHERVVAPLKENLAAAILVRAGWPALAADGAPLLDPMCGSGTLLIEGAWMAADIAPGIQRQRWGFEHWLDHKPQTWARLRTEAEERRQAGTRRDVTIVGRDRDPRAIAAARDNAQRAGVGDWLDLQLGDALDVRPAGERGGLLVTNPPYGERLGDEADLVKLYSLLGVHLKQNFGGWRVALFTSRPDFAQRLGLRADSLHTLYNGAIACKLVGIDIHAQRAGADALPTEGEDFANRLRKNLKHLGKWARRGGIGNYRLYDADLPEYALAVDLYATPELHVHVQEYAPPKTIEPARAERRLRAALAQLRRVLDVPAECLHYKQRRAQKGDAQYQRQAETGRFHTVLEHDCRLQVNFDDYLDTGLFLDHRPMRLRLQREAAGKRFLNLFCYTGAATVHAAVGGAARTLSIDLSNTYLEWAQRNLLINDVHSRLYDRPPATGDRLAPHSFVRSDCRQWLADEVRLSRPAQFDLIFMDPPTFSNSKKMEGTLDIQRDHTELVRHCLTLLAPQGVLYFSTNRRGFKIDPALADAARVEDITAQTLDEDFRRPRPAHRCWRISRAD